MRLRLPNYTDEVSWTYISGVVSILPHLDRVLEYMFRINTWSGAE